MKEALTLAEELDGLSNGNIKLSRLSIESRDRQLLKVSRGLLRRKSKRLFEKSKIQDFRERAVCSH